MRLREAIAFIAFSTTLALAAEVPFEFTGVLTADGKTRIALTNKATKTTEWVETGGQLGGYSVARYDSKEDAVFLKKGTEEVRLPLTTPKVAESGPSPTPLSGASPTPLAATTATPAPANPAPAPATATVQPAPLPPPGPGPTQNVIINVPTAPPPGAPPSDATAATAPSSGAAPTDALTPTGRQPSSPSYTIQGGDTWEKISAASGVPVEELKRLNPVVNGSSLPAGQTIRIR